LELPNDLTPIASADAPIYGTFWSLAYWPDYPPLPYNGFDMAADLYYSPSLGYPVRVIWVDDRAKVAARMLTESNDPPPLPGGDDPGDPDPGPPPPGPIDYGTNLWIQIINITNQLSDAGTQQVANLFLRNTTAGVAYEIISSVNPSVPMSNWVSEGIWLAPGTNTPTPVPIWTRTNELCFRGKVWDGTFSHGVATNGQIYLLCQDTNVIYGIINGITNSIAPIYSNWAVLQPPVWSANFGFSGDDLGPTNYISLFTNQHIHALLGFSRGMSNLALAFNPLTNIDVHSWQNLTYLEMWHATNLVAVNVTNCPKLYRVCFESIEPPASYGIQDVLDFTGCTNLADLRAACNNITNIVFGPNGGSNIWHFCTRDVRNRNPNPVINGIPFKSMPSLRQLWVWRDNSYVDNIELSAAQSPKLESVNASANFFQSINLNGQTNLYEALLSRNRMTNVVITGCAVITNLDCQNNLLPSSVVDDILVKLDQNGLSGGSVILDSDTNGNNGIPTTTGLQSITNLLAKGWLVGYNHPGSTAPQISNIAVSPGSNSATITWTTANTASDSTVNYGTTTSYGSFTNDDSLVTSHSMTVTGLTANTTYHFYIASVSGANVGTSGDGKFMTLGRGPTTNVIWFVSTSSSASMQTAVDYYGATVNWYWANGSNDTGTNVFRNFGSASARSNAVIVDPPVSLIQFGVACQDSANTTLGSIGGLTNYPSLQGLYAYLTSLSTLSLEKCTNLNYVALVGTSPGTTTANNWFHDLASAQAGVSIIGTGGAMCGDSQRSFYCQSGVVDNDSLADRTTLTNKHWTIFFYP
jgi:hypothetical protein